MSASRRTDESGQNSSPPISNNPIASTAYCCQSDGMIGLGCGARSYTTGLHYSTDYAVSQNGVKAILGDYLKRPAAEFAAARHGIHLNAEEQRRRFVILSLLQRSGLDCALYTARFDRDPMDDFPELNDLELTELAVMANGFLRLTSEGLERSDAIGPWLASSPVKRLVEERASCLI